MILTILNGVGTQKLRVSAKIQCLNNVKRMDICPDERNTAHLNIRYGREFGINRDQAGLYLTADPEALRFLLESPMLKNVAKEGNARIGIPRQNSSN